jgi:ABC-type enterochelin transport system permease subunit
MCGLQLRHCGLMTSLVMMAVFVPHSHVGVRDLCNNAETMLRLMMQVSIRRRLCSMIPGTSLRRNGLGLPSMMCRPPKCCSCWSVYKSACGTVH